MQVIFTFFFFVSDLFLSKVLCCVCDCFWSCKSGTMFSTYLDLFDSAVQHSVSFSFSNLILNFFNWRTKLTKLTPCQLAILAGLKNALVIRVTQWRRECKRIWISGLKDGKCWKMHAPSWHLRALSAFSLFLSFIVSLSDWYWVIFSIFRLQKVKLSPWLR